MELTLIKIKLNNINHQNDIEFKTMLTHILSISHDSTDNWQKIGRNILTSIIANIAKEEGIYSFNNKDDEEKFKDHLPNDIANTITQLSKFLLGPSPYKENKITVLFLLLKLFEWMIWNYEGRCIYGENMDQQARLMMETIGKNIEIFGNKDEIWLYSANILEEILKQRPVIGQKPVLGCYTYAERVIISNDAILEDKKNWNGAILPISGELILSVHTKAIDQTSVGISITGRHASGKEEKSIRLEDIFLARLIELCGAI
jgi:hypothetical protein